MGFEEGQVGDVIQNQTSPDFRFQEAGISVTVHVQYLIMQCTDISECYAYHPSSPKELLPPFLDNSPLP